ncbi:unnamed protein product [Caenorhabditis bovis]|uniref:dTDP-D-glucose 4,6-dehydratase n=1 Tax=Caenorhabditis bovis TaxID=2654633 RepID=A0A8S1ENB3_9PELO|nr:unnamed protein product [Caenorhabditis bovis]
MGTIVCKQADNEVSKLIDVQIKKEEVEQRRKLKFLLLGTSDSGKSTIVKQMRIIHTEGFNDTERISAIFQIRWNIVDAFKQISNYLLSEDSDIEIDESEKKILFLFAQNSSRIEVMTEVDEINVINTVRFYPSIREFFRRYRAFAGVPDNIFYFFGELPRILLPNYMPTDVDIVNMRVTTLGVHEICFDYRKYVIRLIDVGGQRTERRKWIHFFEGVTAVMFVASLACFDQFVEEEPKFSSMINKLTDSVELFKSVKQNNFLHKSSFMLFLNKKDVLQEKLRTTEFSDYFMGYENWLQNNNEPSSVCEYVESLFRKGCDESQTIYSHFTVATDTQNIEYVFNSACDIIFQKLVDEVLRDFVRGRGRPIVERIPLDSLDDEPELGESSSHIGMIDLTNPMIPQGGILSKDTITLPAKPPQPITQIIRPVSKNRSTPEPQTSKKDYQKLANVIQMFIDRRTRKMKSDLRTKSTKKPKSKKKEPRKTTSSPRRQLPVEVITSSSEQRDQQVTLDVGSKNGSKWTPMQRFAEPPRSREHVSDDLEESEDPYEAKMKKLSAELTAILKKLEESKNERLPQVHVLRNGSAEQTSDGQYIFIASITLIQDGGTNILVDTGLGTDINSRTNLLKRLEKYDLSPADIDIVVTTHGHPDHTGGIHDFPDATHYHSWYSHQRTKFNLTALFENDSLSLTENVMLVKARGHTSDDIAAIVRGAKDFGDVLVAGDLFMRMEDIDHHMMWQPLSSDILAQRDSRRKRHAMELSMEEPTCVLITGGCGFIGSNFINFIYNKWRNTKIINYDKLAYGASPFHVLEEIRESGRYTFVEAKLEDQETLDNTLESNKVDMVIHFAAITHVDESYSDRIGTIQDNIISTTTLLESIVNRSYKGVKRLVHISTDEVYGDSFGDTTPKSEDASLPNPTNPYAASKAACEMIIRSYWHSYKLPYVMVRMNNVYGPRQIHTKLIPKFTKLALDGKPYPLMGDGLHSRSWMFVEDCSEAISRVAIDGELGQIYNIGTEFEMTNIELTKMIHATVNKLMNREPTPPTFTPIPDRPYHDRRYYIDFSKIHKAMGWKCTTPFSSGLLRTIEYYVKQHLSAARIQG